MNNINRGKPTLGSARYSACLPACVLRQSVRCVMVMSGIMARIPVHQGHVSTPALSHICTHLSSSTPLHTDPPFYFNTYPLSLFVDTFVLSSSELKSTTQQECYKILLNVRYKVLYLTHYVDRFQA